MNPASLDSNWSVSDEFASALPISDSHRNTITARLTSIRLIVAEPERSHSAAAPRATTAARDETNVTPGNRAERNSMRSRNEARVPRFLYVPLAVFAALASRKLIWIVVGCRKLS